MVSVRVRTRVTVRVTVRVSETRAQLRACVSSSCLANPNPNPSFSARTRTQTRLVVDTLRGCMVDEIKRKKLCHKLHTDTSFYVTIYTWRRLVSKKKLHNEKGS